MQTIERNLANGLWREMNNVVGTFDKTIGEAILSTMDEIKVLRFEMVGK